MTSVICTCKGVTKEFIVEAIKNGASTVEEVAEITKATTGPCRGYKCKQKIQELIDEYNQ